MARKKKGTEEQTTNEFLQNVHKSAKNPYSGIADDESQSGLNNNDIDSGSLMLNALVSGSLNGGFPGNHMTALAGPPSSGKTYFVTHSMKRFLDTNPTGNVFVWESEGAVYKEMLEELGVDTSRVVIFPVATIEEFRSQLVNVLDGIGKLPQSKRQPCFVVLDSLGMLGTTKEHEDAASGSDKRDMTRAVLMRSTFRLITLKLRLLNIPMMFTNHVYAVPSAYVPTKAMSGGDGPVFSASVVLFLDNSRDKDQNTKEVTGNFITCHLKKGRFTRDGNKVTIYLDHKRGCLRHYGLLDFGVSTGVFQKVTKKKTDEEVATEAAKKKKITNAVKEKVSAVYILPDGTEVKPKDVYDNPDKYFTPEVMAQLEAAAHRTFTFAGARSTTPDDEDNHDFDTPETDENQDQASDD